MSDARTLLRQHGLQPKRSFGQNFLVSPHVIAQIARLCVEDEEAATHRAFVVEFGAGTGALTEQLVARAGQVVAVERDRELVPVLAGVFAADVESGRLIIREDDAATVDLPELVGTAPAGSAPRVLCGNLPYQITGRLLERAVHAALHFDRAIFMVQAEVADRIVAAPGSKTYGALSVFVQAAFATKRVLTVSRGSFHPAPDVTSAIVRLVPHRPAIARETDRFRAVVKRAFEARRKTLRNAWREVAPADIIAAAAEEAGISLDARGETLGVEAFARMAAALERRLARPPEP
jgi:16S rRNA (adenine1518-N6/adenine1519-N6)-dimethyltransferase